MKLINSLTAMIKRNSTTILSSTAITGVATTAYLAGRASFQAAEVIRRHEPEYGRVGDIRARQERNFKERMKDQVPLVWKLYIPAGVSGMVTVACIVGTTKVSNRRTMAAQAAFVLTERAYSEYRDKVIEEYGEKADQKIRDKVAEDRVRKTAPGQEVIVIPAGNILCCELYTGRYFQSDMESLRKAQNDFNAKLISQDQASLEEWYYLIGLQPTDFSSDFGWNSDRMMELEFSTVLTEDNRPCLAFSYRNFRSLYEGVIE